MKHGVVILYTFVPRSRQLPHLGTKVDFAFFADTCFFRVLRWRHLMAEDLNVNCETIYR
jgi:hypothetical protein